MKAETVSLLDRALEALGIGILQQWPVATGNDVKLMWIRSTTALRARPGDRVPVKGGGFVERTRMDTWVQWRRLTDAEAESQPLQGKVLQPLFLTSAAPLDGDPQEKLAAG